MRATIKFVMLAMALGMFLGSGWVCYSEDKKPCPFPEKPIGKEQFMSAHGITQENYSIWLKEHSVWREKYQDQLKPFTFIPQDFDTERK